MAAAEHYDDLSRAIIKLVKDGNLDSLTKVLAALDASELAMQYHRLPRRHRNLFLEAVETDRLLDMADHLARSEKLQLLELIDPGRASELLNKMKRNDLSYLLADLPDKQVEKLTAEIRQEEKNWVSKHRKFPKGSAGRLMTTRYVWVHQSYTVEKAIEKLKHYEEFAHYLNYIYIINDEKQLVGVLSYRNLLLASSGACVQDVMQTNVAKVLDSAAQSDVAKLIGRYDFVSLPVVNEDDVLEGIIRADAILDIVVKEADKDIEMLFASGKSIDFHTKPLTAAYRRLPWLVLLLFIGLVSGSIISRFEETLEAVVALAFFMPMIAGMTGNTGTQSLAVVVRGLVSEDMDVKKSLRLLFRELIVGVIIGVVCGAVISVIAFIWQKNLTLGLVVGTSLTATLIIGTLAGTIIPLILNKFKVDPAVASGPLITTINDILSLLIYFGIATMFISKLM